ncbi:hypothetical protein [Alkalicoccus daliensis]|uniref:Uncharacterized protein n=1 Tax=Alkalicoccus daliensis TaxID=745820 RepID=A0A1H0CZJ0_9BACI|nr:hypothetical protein [Alkalicoccus daliensis]SDN63335.1 hypothetical protein SAMN04488053_102289 [Alkalicoccus daliensis]
MKKIVTCTAAGAITVLIGCSNNQEEPAENTTAETAEEAADAQEVLQNAITLLEEREDYFEHRVLERTEESDGEEVTEIRERKIWSYPQEDGHILERIETSYDGTAVRYEVSVEGGESQVVFSEDGDTATVMPQEYNPVLTQKDTLEHAHEREAYTLAGTEEIQGGEAYRLTLNEEEEGMENYWFDTETYYLVKKEGTSAEGEVLHVTDEIMEFNLDPEFEEEMFELEEVVPEEMEIERRS